MNNEGSVVMSKTFKFEKRSQYKSQYFQPYFREIWWLQENMTITVYKVKKESMFNLWWHNLLNMSEIRSKEYFRWIHCVKLLNKVKRSWMKVSKRKDYVSKTKRMSGLLFTSSFIPVYAILIKYELIWSLHAQCFGQKANRCLTISCRCMSYRSFFDILFYTH